MSEYPLIKQVNEDHSSIKKMSYDELGELCEEVRLRISEVVQKTGGHLAPCLGVVELIVAAHYVFDLEKDRIVFDVGHQSYAHKILTGRDDRMLTLRQRGGISGFPWGKESPYDVFRSGHASTAISSSLGIAEAYKKTGLERRVIALVGDGSMTGGMSFEGLNNAGELNANLILLFNDNGMSISPTVGALSQSLSRIRRSDFFIEFKRETMRFISKIPKIGDKISKWVMSVEDSGVRIASPWQVFSNLGFNYYGPIDGHDIASVIKYLKIAQKADKPLVVHALTNKGKGYKPGGVGSESMEGPHALPVPGVKAGSDKERAWTRVFSKTLEELVDKDKDIIAITAAMVDGTGLLTLSQKYPAQFYDVGICEEHAVAFAGGLSYGGKKPVFAVYSTFLQRSFDQIYHDIVLQDHLQILLCIDRAGFVGEDGASHQGLYDIAYLKIFPKMILMSPKDGWELKAMMELALGTKAPVAIRYPKGDSPEEGLFVHCRTPLKMGEAEVLCRGKQGLIVAYGSMVESAYRAHKILAEEGIDISVVNARFAKPINKDFYNLLLGEHPWTMTLEEGVLAGGLGESIRSLHGGGCRVFSYGAGDVLVEQATREQQLKQFDLDVDSIVQNVRRRVAEETGQEKEKCRNKGAMIQRE